MTTKDNVTPSILYKSNLWREDDIIVFFSLSHPFPSTTLYGSGFFSPLLHSLIYVENKRKIYGFPI